MRDPDKQWEYLKLLMRAERVLVPLCWVTFAAMLIPIALKAFHGHWAAAGFMAILDGVLLATLLWDPPLLREIDPED